MILALPSLLFAIAGLTRVQAADFQDPGQDNEEPDQGRTNLVQLPPDYVRFARVPEGGRLPRLARVGEALALLYFTGEADGGDLHLARSADEAQTFTPGVRLNPAPGTVSAPDGIHTGSIDLGPDGRAHVAWISNEERPRLFYVRDAADGTIGAVQDLGAPEGLCGTAALAVDAQGWIYLFYAAFSHGQEGDGASNGRIWFRRSSNGVEFTEPVTVDRETDGISGRSMLAAHVDAVKGTVFAMYRGEAQLRPGQASMDRGMHLLASVDKGETFERSSVDNHRQQRDPGSRTELSQEAETTLACWAGNGSVYWSLIRRGLKKANLPVEPREGPDVYCHQPTAAANDFEILMAWLERPRGEPTAAPRLAWRIWLREGRATQGKGAYPEPLGETVPVAFPRREGGFTILF